MQRENLLTIEQIAAHFDVSVSSLHRIRIDPELSFPQKIKFSGRVMFDRTAVDE